MQDFFLPSFFLATPKPAPPLQRGAGAPTPPPRRRRAAPEQRAIPPVRPVPSLASVGSLARDEPIPCSPPAVVREAGARRPTPMAIASTPAQPTPETRTAMLVLVALSVCHLLNDTIQSLLPALYPLLEANYALSFTQIGMIHLVFQVTASLLQPLVGLATDKRPMFRLSTIGMGASLIGLVLLAFAAPLLEPAPRRRLRRHRLVDLPPRLVAASPAPPRAAATASPSRCSRSAATPAPRSGRCSPPSSCCRSASRASPGSPCWRWSRWSCSGTSAPGPAPSTCASRAAGKAAAARTLPLPRSRVIGAIAILALLIFSKYIYVASLTSFYTFFLIERFGVSVQTSQLLLFVFLGAVAAGTFIGGPVGDRIGRKAVIWVSILGVLPFTLALPYAGLGWTVALSAIIGFVIASAFSAILVYAQDAGARPGRHDLRPVLRLRLRRRRRRRRAARRCSPTRGASTSSSRSAPSCR